MACSPAVCRGVSLSLLLLLLITSSLVSCSTAQTTSALLNKARRAGTAVSNAGSSVKAGVRASARLSKKAAGSAVSAGQFVVEAGSSARRASQRTWEAARAARDAAKAAYSEPARQQQQQQVIKQDAQKLTADVFPVPAADTAAAAAAGGEQVQGRCDLGDTSACAAGLDNTAAAAAAPTDHKGTAGTSSGKAQSIPTVSKAADAHRRQHQPPAPPAAAGAPKGPQHAAKGSLSAVWLLLSHCLAAALGWLLRSHTHTSPKQQSQQQSQQQPQQQKSQQKKAGSSSAPQPPAAAATTSQSSSASKRRAKEQRRTQPPAAVAAVSTTSSSSSRRSSGSSQPNAVAEQGQAQRERAEDAAAAPAGEQQHDIGSNSMQQGADHSTLKPATDMHDAAPAAPAAAAAEVVVDEDGVISEGDSYVLCDSDDDISSADTVGQQNSRPAGSSGHSAGVARAGGRLRRRRVRGYSSGAVLVPYGGAHRRHHHHHHNAAVLARRHGGALLPAGAGGVGGQQAVQVVGQQTMIINHNNLVISDEVVHLLMPVAKVIQQVGNDLQGLTAMGRRWMGYNEQQDAHQALAAQQELLDRAGHLGQLVGLVTMGLVALRAGRLWEVHQVCQASLQQPAGWKGWAHQMAGTQPFMRGLTYLNCCSQQLGLYAAGMFLLYLLMRLSWSGAGQRSGPRGRPSQAFQLDLLVVKAGLCSWLGAHVVHCLGGAWLPWLVGWLAWCGVQLWLNVRVVASLHSSVAIVLVALVMPLVNAIGPFRPGAVALQGWAVEVFPVLAWAPSLGQLLPGSWW